MVPAPEFAADLAATTRELSKLTEQAMHCADACCGAVATLATGGSDRRATATHPDLTALLSVEMASGEGPTPSALDTGEPVGAQDLLTEDRWPRYRAMALDSGIRSSVTMPFDHTELEVTLSLYSFQPGAFPQVSHHPVYILGEHFTKGLVRDHYYRAALAEVDQLETALRSRAVIDQASGILMHVMGCGAAEAFAVLRHISQRSNRKLAEVAAEVVRDKGQGLEKELPRLAPPL
ncbi:ANTAR domain-containing response regulator [Streptomyces sp. NPDC052236]|uniref:ANTAR domain-containing response regulator n=1 Tax=Streptomyces sp. NPDC052236 TaxID=3365686 RepID=UPI0037CE43AB